MKVISNDGCDVFIQGDYNSIYIRKTDDFDDNNYCLIAALEDILCMLNTKEKPLYPEELRGTLFAELIEKGVLKKRVLKQEPDPFFGYKMEGNEETRQQL